MARIARCNVLSMSEHRWLTCYSGCWGSEAANRINGTEGSVFEPLLVYNKSRSVSIYNEQLYR